MAERGSGSRSGLTIPMKVTVDAIRRRFPSVKNISTSKALDLCQTNVEESGGEELVVLDSRPDVEWKVSHIAGSKRVSPVGSDVANTLEDIQNKYSEDKTVNVVCYCSLGYRSSLYADQINNNIKHLSGGPTINTFNIEGGLFQWANEGKPMVDSHDVVTTFAHPYSFVWGKLLRRSLRREEYIHSNEIITKSEQAKVDGEKKDNL